MENKLTGLLNLYSYKVVTTIWCPIWGVEIIDTLVLVIELTYRLNVSGKCDQWEFLNVQVTS